MQFSTSFIVLFLTATASLATAQYADEHFVRAREAVAEAEHAAMVARSEYDLLKRMGGNGECGKPSKSSGKRHCMKGGRSCAAMGCASTATTGQSCLCDAGFTA